MTTQKLIIKEFTCGVYAEERGYTFTLEFPGETPDEESMVFKYRTSSNFEGLFVWSDSFHRWDQCRGSGQFSLSEDPEIAKRQIISFWRDDCS